MKVKMLTMSAGPNGTIRQEDRDGTDCEKLLIGGGYAELLKCRRSKWSDYQQRAGRRKSPQSNVRRNKEGDMQM